jgi:hypothetical protein
MARGLLTPYGTQAAAETDEDAAKNLRRYFLDWLRQDYDEEALRARFRSKAWADRIVDGVLRRE